MDSEAARKAFNLLHSNLAREGLGSDETTRKLLSFLPKESLKTLDNGRKRIALDVGCGTGPATKVLCDVLDNDCWEIYGIDMSQSYLDELPEGVNKLCLDMRKLDTKFGPESVDLILTEGAAYSIGGLAEAAKIWHSILKPNGLLLGSDLCWCYSDDPTTLCGEDLWKEEYPGMQHLRDVTQALRFDTPGYEILDVWESPDEDADNYYIPLQERAEMLRKKETSPEALEVLDSHQREYEAWLKQREVLKNGKHFNYIQFACKRRSDLAIPNWWRCLSRRIDTIMQELKQSGILTSLTAPQKLADIGCGRGEFAHIMESRGHSVTGFDMSPDMLRDARKLSPNIPYFDFDLNKDEPRAEHYEAFDGAWSSYVAGFFPGEQKLARYIESCGKFVKPGGWIFILEIDGFFAIHEQLSTRTKEKLSEYETHHWPKNGYDPYTGGALENVATSELCAQSYKLIQSYDFPDDEICSNGPAWHNDILHSWEARWNRPLIGLLSFLGEADYDAMKAEFLACLTRKDHSIASSHNSVKAILLKKLPQ